MPALSASSVLDALSRAAKIRVKSVANPILWLCTIVLPVSIFGSIISFLLVDITSLGYIILGFGGLCLLYTLWYLTYFALNDPEKLQSEEWQLKHYELTLQNKGDAEPKLIVDSDVIEEPEFPSIEMERSDG